MYGRGAIAPATDNAAQRGSRPPPRPSSRGALMPLPLRTGLRFSRSMRGAPPHPYGQGRSGGEALGEDFSHLSPRLREAALDGALGAPLAPGDLPDGELCDRVHEEAAELHGGKWGKAATSSPLRHLLRRSNPGSDFGPADGTNESIASRLSVCPASLRSIRHVSRCISLRALATSSVTSTETLAPPGKATVTEAPHAPRRTESWECSILPLFL